MLVVKARIISATIGIRLSGLEGIFSRALKLIFVRRRNLRVLGRRLCSFIKVRIYISFPLFLSFPSDGWRNERVIADSCFLCLAQI